MKFTGRYSLSMFLNELSCSEFLHQRLPRHSEGQLFKCSFGLQNNNIILLFLKKVAEIFSTLAITLKYAKALGTNSQKPGHFYKCKKPVWMEIFGSRRRHAWGKEDV
jgi:hypothetical protein